MDTPYLLQQIINKENKKNIGLQLFIKKKGSYKLPFKNSWSELVFRAFFLISV